MIGASLRPTSLGDLRISSRQAGGKPGAPFAIAPPLTMHNGRGWRLAGSTLDVDFVNNRIFGGASISSAFACVRATSGKADDAAGAWLDFLANTLRRTDKGLRVEQGRTNGVRNNSGQGAGPALPTNWIYGALPSGITVTSSAAGVENGIDYVDVTIAGTAGSSSDSFVAFEGAQQIAALSGQTWTNSFFLKAINGTIPNVYNRLRERGSAGAQLAVVTSNALTVAGLGASLGLSRQTFTGTLGNASTAFVMPTIEFSLSSGVTYNFTLRIGWPQAEQAAFATSPIRTAGAAVLRSADAITASATFDSSAYIEWTDIGPVSANRTLWSAYIDANNYFLLRVGTDNKVHFLVVNGGVTQCDLVSTNAVVAGQTYKAAVRWGANDFAMRVSAALGSPANDNSGTPPAGTPTVNLGNDGAGAGFLNAVVRRFAIQQARDDAQLAAQVG